MVVIFCNAVALVWLFLGVVVVLSKDLEFSPVGGMGFILALCWMFTQAVVWLGWATP